MSDSSEQRAKVTAALAEAIAEKIDPAAFVGADGEVDAARVASAAGRVTGRGSGREQGLAEARRRFGVPSGGAA